MIARSQHHRFQVKWYWCFRAGVLGAYQGGVYQALHCHKRTQQRLSFRSCEHVLRHHPSACFFKPSFTRSI